MRGYTCFVLVFITVTFPLYVLGYSHGRVSSVCASMVPSHGSTEQTSAAPYQITANSSTFNPGDTITVTLKSNSGDNFKGFLLEARAAGSSSDLMPLGTFSTSLAAQTLNCNVGGITHQNSAVSHTSGSVKTQIVVTWIAPDTGNIEFRATVVKTQPIFWTLVKSETIQRSVTNVTSTTARNPSVTNVSSTTARNPSVTNVSSTTARNPSVTNVSSTTARNPSVTNVSSTTTRNPSVTNVSSATTRDPRTSLTANTDSNVDSFSSDGCGTTKFCFSNPGRCNPVTDPDCYFMSSVPVSNQGLRFGMSGKANGYISLGFSDDQMMGNDDIYICGTDISGEIKVQRAYSTGRSPPRIEQLGEVDVMTVANRNGVIQCSFVTRNNISTAQRAANNMHYLFIAYGAASGGQISKHANIPFISTEKVDVSVIQRAEGNNGRSIFIKTHAALMLIAWMTTGSIGMIIAKFFKEIGGTKKILGKNIWFQLHLSLMLLTVAITIIGFVLIFVHVKGWSYSAGNHPLLGCIVLGLTLIQPTVAIFRPAPDHKRRFIFNSFHAFMGIAIKILAVATLFLGFILINVAPNKWPVKVLGGFVGWEFLAHTLLLTFCCCKENALYSKLKKLLINIKDIQVGYGAKLRLFCPIIVPQITSTFVTQDFPSLKFLILIVYLCGNLAFLIALLVGIEQT